ncbi:hypothetical protein [Hugenholtzia roseola]|uniref:hypothetical protein n=1 Tax=Hugenholtzia roseola TaxID=1002 RepID=UPI00047D7A6A|nr:hypothetical protein [Hugenholtzia roseola]
MNDLPPTYIVEAVWFEDGAPDPFTLRSKMEELSGMQVICQQAKYSEKTYSIIEKLPEDWFNLFFEKNKIAIEFISNQTKSYASIVYYNKNTTIDLRYFNPMKMGYMEVLLWRALGALGGKFCYLGKIKDIHYRGFPKNWFLPYEEAKTKRRFY